METISASPIAEASENRPPTHWGTGKIISGSTPHCLARSGAPVTATRWRPTPSDPTPSASQARAPAAATRVSAVVNDLEDTTTRVETGSSPRRASTRSVPSRLDEKRSSTSGWARSARASLTMAGPRCEPPTPRATTESMGVPVAPTIAPERMRRARWAMRSRFSWTAATTSAPSTSMVVSRGARRAVWRAGRPSVEFTGSPESMRSTNRPTSRSVARSTSRSTVVAVNGWRDRSRRRSATSRVSRPIRSASPTSSRR